MLCHGVHGGRDEHKSQSLLTMFICEETMSPRAYTHTLMNERRVFSISTSLPIWQSSSLRIALVGLHAIIASK